MANTSKEHGSLNSWEVGRGPSICLQTRLTIHRALVVRATHSLQLSVPLRSPMTPSLFY